MPTLTIKSGRRSLSLSKPEIKRLEGAADVLEACVELGVEGAAEALAGILAIIKATESSDGEPT